MRAAIACLLLGLTVPALFGKPIMLRFDEAAETSSAHDAGSGNYTFTYREGGVAEIDTKDKKFGAGSLKLSPPNVSHSVDGFIWQSLKDHEEMTRPIEQMTIGVWVKLPDSYDGTGFQIARRDQNHGSGDESGFFAFTYNGKLKALRFDAANHSPVSAKISLQPGQWIHLGMTYDRGIVTFYENGVPYLAKQSDASAVPEMPLLPALTLFKAFGSMPGGTRIDDFYLDLETALPPEKFSVLAEKGSDAIPLSGGH